MFSGAGDASIAETMNGKKYMRRISIRLCESDILYGDNEQTCDNHVNSKKNSKDQVNPRMLPSIDMREKG